MKQQQELSLLNNFEKDSKWFHENINKLREKGFTNQFVAIKNAIPIASGKDIDVVIKKIEEKKQNPSYIFIEFVYPKGRIIIL